MTLAAVQSFSRRFFAGVLDESGRPYVELVQRVADRVAELGGNRYDRAAALLVGVIEHSYATTAELLERGVPAQVVQRVDAADRRPFEPVAQHLARLRQCSGAALLKRAQIVELLRSEPPRSWRRRELICLSAALDVERPGEAHDAGTLIAALDAAATDERWYAAELLGRLRAADAGPPLARG